MFLAFLLIAERVAKRGALDSNLMDDRASMQLTLGPPDKLSRTCFNRDISESISTVDLTSYNGRDSSRPIDLHINQNRSMKIQRTQRIDTLPSSRDENVS